MKCNNRLCIYQKENKCTSKNEIELDWHGICKNMVPIHITEENLYYEKLVAKLEIQDNNHFLETETGVVKIINKVLDDL